MAFSPFLGNGCRKKVRKLKIKKVDKAKKGMFRQYRAALKEFKQSIKTKNSSIKMSIRNCVCTWKLGKQGIVKVAKADCEYPIDYAIFI